MMALPFALSTALISLQPAAFNEIDMKQIVIVLFWLSLLENPSINKTFFGKKITLRAIFVPRDENIKYLALLDSGDI